MYKFLVVFFIIFCCRVDPSREKTMLGTFREYLFHLFLFLILMPAFLVFFFVENEFRRKQANSKTGRPAEFKQLFMPFFKITPTSEKRRGDKDLRDSLGQREKGGS